MEATLIADWNQKQQKFSGVTLVLRQLCWVLCKTRDDQKWVRIESVDTPLVEYAKFLGIEEWTRSWLIRLVAVFIGATLAIPVALAADDAVLLKGAQKVFQPLPKDMAMTESPITAERCISGA